MLNLEHGIHDLVVRGDSNDNFPNLASSFRKTNVKHNMQERKEEKGK